MFLALNLILTKTQRFGKLNFFECNLKMGVTKQINIKNRTYYFYNDQIDWKDFDARLLKIEKKDHNEIEIYYIGYVTIKLLIKLVHQKNVSFITIGFLKILDLNLKNMFVINVMIY